jgi:hypothetical protein
MGTFGNAPVSITTNNIERIKILGNGSVGIGVNPSFPMDLQGDFNAVTMFRIQNTNTTGWSGIIMDNSNGTSRAMFGIGNSGASYAANIVYAGSSNAMPFGLFSNNTERMRITPTGEVGINTTTPTAELEVNGYTKLGSDAPAVKMKKLTGTTSSTQGTSVSLNHGLNANKILSISVLVDYSAGNCVPPSYTAAANYEYNYYLNGTAISIININGNSALVLGKPVRVLITYEE